MPTRERLSAMKSAKAKQIENRKRAEMLAFIVVIVVAMAILGNIARKADKKIANVTYTYEECMSLYY